MELTTQSSDPDKNSLDAKTKKSRAAQKRYRDRQKAKREGIEDQVAVLTQRISEMQAAHDSLQSRNKSLERFAELAQERDDSGATEGDDGPEIKAWQAAFAEAMNQMRGPESRPISPEECHPARLDPRQWQSTRQESCLKLCKMFGSDLNPDEKAKAEIINSIITSRKNRLRLMEFLILPRSSIPISDSFGSTRSHLIEDQMPKFLPELVASVDLSSEQKAQILAAKKRFCKDTSLIGLQRTGILQDLKECNNVESEGDFLDNSSTALSHAAEAQLRLNESLVAEKRCMLQFAISFMEAVTPWQEARLIVESYLKFGTILETWDVANVIELEQLPKNEPMTGDSGNINNMPFFGFLPQLQNSARSSDKAHSPYTQNIAA